ncbi:unnamed protein product [Discosporangium mesarthrocarpum]
MRMITRNSYHQHSTWQHMAHNIFFAKTKGCVLEDKTRARHALHKVVSWSQKKRLLRHLGTFLTCYKEAESKLMRVEPLSTLEQQVYDNMDSESLGEKATWLNLQVKAMVETGQLTKEERQQLLSQVSTKLEGVQAEAEVAKLKGDTVALENIKKAKAQLEGRHRMVSSHPPVSHRVKHEDELRRITAKIIHIEKLENTRGRLLKMDEVKQVGGKGELEERAKVLEQDSRGWFEEDSEFEARLKEVRKQGQRLASKTASGAKGGGGNNSSSSSSGRGGGRNMAMDSDGWKQFKRR